MRPGRKFSYAQVVEARAAWMAGETLQSLSHRLGASRPVIHHMIRGNTYAEVPMPPWDPKPRVGLGTTRGKLTHENLGVMVEMRRMKHTYVSIAERFAVTPQGARAAIMRASR